MNPAPWATACARERSSPPWHETQRTSSWACVLRSNWTRSLGWQTPHLPAAAEAVGGGLVAGRWLPGWASAAVAAESSSRTKGARLIAAP